MKTKKISLIEAVSIGIGGMVGGGIFAVLGEAVLLGHGATPIAFIIAGLIALLTAYSYAKLSVIYSDEGGTITYITKGFGNNIYSKSINLILWLSYLVTISLYAVAFGSYCATFFPITMQGILLKHILITLAIVLPMILNMLNAKIIAMFENYIVLIKVLILIVIIFFGFKYVNPTHFSDITQTSTFSIIIAGMIIFVAYEGFELIANSAKEIENPEKNLPRAFYIAVIFVIILYVLISIITVGTLDEQTIIISKDYALAEATKPALGTFGFKLVGIAAILATFSAINATIYGNARLGYSLAIKRKLPKVFSKKVWHDSYFGVILVGSFAIILANSIDLKSISIIASAGFLLIFTFVNISALLLREKIKASIFITFFSSLSTFLALSILIVETYKTNIYAIYIFICFILFAVLFELTYGRIKDNGI